VGIAGTLFERRPDVAAAERRMADANDQIGIAKVAYFPQVTLGGAAGFQGTQVPSRGAQKRRAKRDYLGEGMKLLLR
jgi:outer membrane protein TolC